MGSLLTGTADAYAYQALEITQRMTDFNCDFHPDEPIKYEMRQFANKHFKSIVTSRKERFRRPGLETQSQGILGRL
jgi:hypothetical protein